LRSDNRHPAKHDPSGTFFGAITLICAIVGDGCAGPPYPSIRIDHALGLADGLAGFAGVRAARIFAPMMAPP
jgi:hypothetical protein